MNYFESQYEDERQFNMPGQFPGGGQTGGFFPGGQFPGFPGGGQTGGTFPGGQFPGFPGGGGQTQVPTSPPPSFTPQQPQFQTFAVDPGAIRGCLFRYTFIWLENGTGFWFFPTFVGRTSVAGFRWRFNHWSYFGIDLNRIASFQCF
ncbi:hypothetical protein [Ornithinibacillus bavariensis]|uniref:Transporter n=1 Tax=Ornithinibacillus bavariensis TaxID=545502 RepID=A0A920C5Z3_9BACI|nr:hypothetical protein [Ornithinibacillus bavariensis]GIO27250.1 hypothetical protein J43TS3_18610 [Ornithinibacillus bavariensis]